MATAAHVRASAAAAESARLRAWYLSRRDAAGWAGGIDDDSDAAEGDDAAVRAHLARLTAFPLPLVIPRESLPQTQTQQTQAPTS